MSGAGAKPISSAAVDSSDCHYDFESEFLFERFIIVAFVMTAICAIGVLGNCVVIAILTRKRMRSSSNWYLVILAVFDTSVMIATVLLYVVEVVYDYERSFTLYRIWFSYVRFIYVISHFVQVCTVYLTLAATIERFITLWFPHYGRNCCSGSRTCIWIKIVLVLTITVTITKYWELEVKHNPNCEGVFGEYALVPSAMLMDPTYEQVYSVWLSNLLFIFLPFLTLSILNGAIFYKMRQQQKEEFQKRRRKPMRHISKRLRETMETTASNLAPDGDLSEKVARNLNDVRQKKREDEQNKEATVVLLIVVLVFLLCNAPQFVLTMGEQFDSKFLNANKILYAISRDIINLLTVINSSANFVIYFAFGEEFRRELRRMYTVPLRRIRKYVRKRQKTKKKAKEAPEDLLALHIERSPLHRQRTGSPSHRVPNNYVHESEYFAVNSYNNNCVKNMGPDPAAADKPTFALPEAYSPPSPCFPSTRAARFAYQTWTA